MAKIADWTVIENDYRAGIKTLRVIGAEHGISNVAVLRHAQRYGWARDLGERIRAKAAEKISNAAIKKASKEEAANEAAVIDANASLQASVIVSHRKDIQALRLTVASLAGELGVLTNGELQAALEIVLDDKLKETDSQPRRTALIKAYDAAMALGSRAGAGRALAAALSTLIDKERQAFGIDREGTDRKSLGEWLDTIA